MNKSAWFWFVVSLILALSLFNERRLNDLQKENIQLQRRVMEIQDEWCYGLQESNQVCEEWVLMMIDRLALDRGVHPVLTTALRKRTSKRYKPLVGPTTKKKKKKR